HFIGVKEILKANTENTKMLLLKELEIKLGELNEDWHYSSLEKIFIEKRIYRNIEEETTWEGVMEAIRKGLKPYLKLFRRAITDEDIVRLTEIKIKRISKFDSFKADEHIQSVEKSIEVTQHNIEHLTEYAIAYFETLLKKYGKGKERKSIIKPFETIEAAAVAIANTKLYVNKKDGFIGTGLKKDELAFECSDLDLIIIFRKDGHMMVTKVSDKTFVGKDIISLAVFDKNDDRTTYNMLYLDGKTGVSYAKRFNVTGITRDKDYDLTKGHPLSKVLYFSSNPNGEAETVTLTLSPGSKARNKQFDFSFENIEIKGRGAGGNQVTKYPIKSVRFKEKGKSTLGAIKVYFDEQFGRLNKEGNGKLLGNFEPDDKAIAFYKDGSYELLEFDVSIKIDTKQLLCIDHFDPEKIISTIYLDYKNSVF